MKDYDGENKKISNGLPEQVKYCVKCNISNQQPTSTNEYRHDSETIQLTIDFDDDNICAACKANDIKWDGTVNWEDREKELGKMGRGLTGKMHHRGVKNNDYNLLS